MQGSLDLVRKRPDFDTVTVIRRSGHWEGGS